MFYPCVLSVFIDSRNMVPSRFWHPYITGHIFKLTYCVLKLTFRVKKIVKGPQTIIRVTETKQFKEHNTVYEPVISNGSTTLSLNLNHLV